MGYQVYERYSRFPSIVRLEDRIATDIVAHLPFTLEKSMIRAQLPCGQRYAIASHEAAASAHTIQDYAQETPRLKARTRN